MLLNHLQIRRSSFDIFQKNNQFICNEQPEETNFLYWQILLLDLHFTLIFASIIEASLLLLSIRIR